MIDREDIKYTRWVRQEKYDSQSQKMISRVKPEEILLSKADFVAEFSERFQKLEAHMERFKNQHQMIRHLGNHLEEREITCHLDFAENYLCCYQREPSQTYYDKRFITIHPFVIHYQQGGMLQTKCYCAVSDDLVHTFAAVLAFLKKLIPLVKTEIPSLRCIHFVSDSPVTQYRNRSAVAALSRFYSLFDKFKCHILQSGEHGNQALQ